MMSEDAICLADGTNVNTGFAIAPSKIFANFSDFKDLIQIINTSL